MPKTKLSVDEVRHVAKLAKLALTAREEKKFSEQLSRVLDYASQIDLMDTRAANIAYQVTIAGNRFREDIVETARALSQEEALANAKRKHNGYFVVKAIFNSR